MLSEIRPVGQADRVRAGIPDHDTMHIQNWSKHLLTPARLASYSIHPYHYLEVTLSTKDSTRSRWLDVCSRPVLLCSSSALAEDADRPPNAATPCQVPQSQKLVLPSAQQHTYTYCILPGHPSGCTGASSRYLVLRSAGEPPSAACRVLCNNWFHQSGRHTASQANNGQIKSRCAT